MKTMKHYALFMIVCVLICACEENEPNVPQTATIRIINAIQDVGTIDLRGFEGSISFFGTNTINYGSSFRFTLPANTPAGLTITPATDTLNIITEETLMLEQVGGIYSLFLLGDSSQAETFMIEDEFINYQDSIYGVRFINLSEDSGPVNVRNIALDSAGVRDTTLVKSEIDFRSFTTFSQYVADSRIENHTFQFLDESGNVLASTTVPRFFFFAPPYFKNLTIGLIGRADDGQGGNNLSIVEIEHFE